MSAGSVHAHAPYLKNMNPHLQELDRDVLYHLGLDTSMDLRGQFGDVKFVCMGGSPPRMRGMMRRAIDELGLRQGIPFGCDFTHVGKTERYHMFKVGPLLCVNHGMGMPSLSILLQELTKLFYYAGATDFVFFRVGTSGGVGVDPGTVVVSDYAVNTALEQCRVVNVLGKQVKRPTHLDRRLREELMRSARDTPDIPVVVGSTMGTDGFYEEQARMDGCFCEYSEDDRMQFLLRAHELGIRNIEMESVLFADHCNRAGIPAAIVCTVLLNRLQGDQVTAAAEELHEFSERAVTVVLNCIRRRMAATGLSKSSSS